MVHYKQNCSELACWRANSAFSSCPHAAERAAEGRGSASRSGLRTPPLPHLRYSLTAAVQGIFLTKATGRLTLVRSAMAPLAVDAATFSLQDLRDLAPRAGAATPEEPAGSQAAGSASGLEGPGSEMGKMAAAVGPVVTLATEPGEDAFRKLFRFYRQSRPGTADLGGVIDFSAAQAGRSTDPGAQKVRKEERRAPPHLLASLAGKACCSRAIAVLLAHEPSHFGDRAVCYRFSQSRKPGDLVLYSSL